MALTLGGFAIYWTQPGPLISVAGLFIAGLGVANLYPLCATLAFEAAPGQSDAAGARLTFASGSAILAAPLLLGALSDLAGLRIAYTIVPLFVLLAYLTLHLGNRAVTSEIPETTTLATPGG
jgi:fucose permease